MTEPPDPMFDWMVLISLGAATVSVYLLPAIVAYRRRTELRGLVLLVNLLAGWTALGWFACLILAGLGRVADPAPPARPQLPQEPAPPPDPHAPRMTPDHAMWERMARR